jgi:hypothetical protein
MRTIHCIQSIEIEYFQERVVREHMNRHPPPVLACIAARVNDDEYDEF